MEAGPTVTPAHGHDQYGSPAASAAARKPRTLLSRQESILLRTALGVALLAVAISLISRFAGDLPIPTPIVATSILVVGLGGIGIALLNALVRISRASRTAAAPISLTGILDELPMGIAVWDRYGTLLRTNRLYTDFFELAPPDIITGSLRRTIRAKGGRALDALMEEQETQNTGLVVERRVVTGGAVIETIAAAEPSAETGTITTDDETYIRDLIGEISRLSVGNDELQSEIGRLEERISTETQTAETAVKAKSEFLSHMSHELRTPLNAILGFADMMRSEVFGPLGHEKYQEYANDIHTGGTELLSHIADILDVSQIQSGEVPIERQRIDLVTSVSDCLSLLRPTIFASGIALTELIDDLPTVFADPLAVRQILLHVLSNAMKFTPGGGRISIQADVQEKAVSIIIDDTGIGIAPDIMEGIDQPFAALDHDALISGDETTGLGVGLSVSSALARLNGGSLSIKSEEGYGTTVRITLPRR